MNQEGPIQSSWCLSFRDPETGRALELRFAILVSKNGFQRIAEVWGIFFEKINNKDSQKTAITVVREAQDLSKFIKESENSFQISGCSFSSCASSGSIQSKGQTLEWNLKFKSRQKAFFDFTPPALKKFSLSKSVFVTPQPDLLFSGTVKVNGRVIEFNDTPGRQTHQNSQRNAHSLISGYANIFKNEQGAIIPFIFEAVSFRQFVIGSLPSPRVSSFYFVYEGKEFYFNSLRDAVHLRSKSDLSEWTFRAEKGDLVFQGSFSFELKDFAGISFEDTSGSIIYSSSSKFSDLKIQIYDHGKLKAALVADQTASVEILSRKKSPYVQVLN